MVRRVRDSAKQPIKGVTTRCHVPHDRFPEDVGARVKNSIYKTHIIALGRTLSQFWKAGWIL